MWPDGDGHPEVVVVNVNKPLALLKNRAAPGNAAVIRLRGRASNRSAIGARVEVTVDGRTMLQFVLSGGSYFSQSDLALHFGLGSSLAVEKLRVVWPLGRVQEWSGLPANRRYILTEGADQYESSALAGRGDAGAERSGAR